MPKEVVQKMYACSVCKVEYRTHTEAVSCERECKDKRRVQKEQDAIFAEIKQIRNTVETPDELFTAIKEFMKKHLGKDIVFRADNVRNMICDVCISRMVMGRVKNSFPFCYYRYTGKTFIDESNMLMQFGIRTHSGGGDGKVMHYPYCDLILNELPKIKHNLETRKDAVIEASEELIAIRDSLINDIHSDEKYKETCSQIDELLEQIADLKEQVSALHKVKASYVDDMYGGVLKDKYEAVVNKLPKQMSKEVPDPGLYHYSLHPYV